MTEEEQRVAAARGRPDGWRLWGPYLAERAWGTVREDYSAAGDAWSYFPHDHARSRAYRWNEDGIAGFCDIRQNLCFALALWNGRDPILKERLFGLTAPEGNHGEDVKELYYYLDATPTYSYAKYLYKYPQVPFPYGDLVEENRRRGRNEPEYELIDTGVLDRDRYFDVVVEYAKASPDDLLIRITATNRGPDTAHLHLIPTLWFRNTWSWGCDDPQAAEAAGGDARARPELRQTEGHEPPGMRRVTATHPVLGAYTLHCATQAAAAGANGSGGGGTPQLLFTENETNRERLWGAPNASLYVKDGIHEAVVKGDRNAVNPDGFGTKVGVVYRREIAPGGQMVVSLRLAAHALESAEAAFGADTFERTFADRIAEADAFYARFAPDGLSEDARNVQRQAFAGLLWSKQCYRYDVSHWLEGDPASPPPPADRKTGRNADWGHLNAGDVLSVPDKWEYPWFAAWDLAFHTISLALVDADSAKHQLLLLCREWYMHPNGQIPAYEWAFGDVNPPVHAWAALRVYQIERRLRGLGGDEPGDTQFLERVFHKLLLNFTWWVNRKDREGNNIFEGGFLGLDNIGVFDRSAPLQGGGRLEQSDGTSWMAMYCLNLLAIALELARYDAAYQDVAVKFAEHFVYIAHAMTDISSEGLDLWEDEDGFFYDVLHLPPGPGRPEGGLHLHLRVRSMVGLIPLFAVEAFDRDVLDATPDFRRRIDWFLRHKPELARGVAHIAEQGQADRSLFSVVDEDRLRRILARLLDEDEFLSPYGIRSLSRRHRDHPFVLPLDGAHHGVAYEPAESTDALFGGNSNWRGPVWFPVNYLLIESLQRFDYVYGARFRVECPTGSGVLMSLGEVAAELSRRLTRVFLRGDDGGRPVYGPAEANAKFQTDPHFRDLILFFEYFHGDTGAGLGASHQTGWTALVAKLIEQSGAPPPR